MKLKELYKENRKPIIYLDLDGVLANFNEAVKQYTGKYPSEQNDDEMWEIIQKDPHFYSKLKEMESAEYLFGEIQDIAKKYGYDIKILTAIPRKSTMPFAEDDKRKWVKEHFGNIEVVLGPYSHDKWKHAKSGDILIDDRKSNIDDWVKKGNSIGILYKNPNDTIEKLLSIVGEK
jgi:5'(3')-deoxyribonucleotidase